jgi:tripartite ATP-independent transporter DctM subunit
MFALFIIGLPISFSMAFIGFLGFAYIVDFRAALNVASTDILNIFSGYSLTVVPVFILMGQIAANAGIPRRLYDVSFRFVGHIPGGLALSTILGAVLFKAVCGSMPATVATFATVAVPEMDKYHYDKRLSCGTVATAGTLGMILPPSVALIIYGIICQQSIVKLFLAGIFPGLLIAFSFTVSVVGWCKINPMMGPAGERSTWRQRFVVLPSVIPVIAIFIIVIGGMMMGYFTPTEAGSIGAFAVLIISLIRRDIGFKGVIDSFLSSLTIACMVLFLLAGATILGHFFTITNIPFFLADWLISLQMPRELIMVIIILIYLIGGEFIEDFAFLVMVTPLFLPLVGKLGYDPIWFGIVLMVTIMIGMIIPPVAVCVFIASSITKVPLGTIYKGSIPTWLDGHLSDHYIVLPADCALATESTHEMISHVIPGKGLLVSGPGYSQCDPRCHKRVV